MPDNSDALAYELSEAMAFGNAAATESFCRKYFDALYKEARRATRRDESFCLDVVQESLLRIVRSIRAVDSEARLRAWLGLVVRTTAYDLLRAERRRNAHERVLAPIGPEQPEFGDEEQIEQLNREIAKLDPKLARMLAMRFTEGLTLAKIAEAFGLSVGTVDGRLRRALVSLRVRLTEVYDD